MTAAFRQATAADVTSEYLVFCRAQGRLRVRHGYPWVDPSLAWFASINQQLLRTDPSRCFVAEADGRVVGFSAAFVRDDTWFLAALFVDPDYQSQGTGSQLFALSARDAPPRRITITDAIQPISTAIYARFGLIPIAPILLFEGQPAIEAPPDLEAKDARSGELAMLDRAGYDFDRAVDHQYWSHARTCTIWHRDGLPVAYAYRSLTGSIGPLAGRNPTSAADALRAELAGMPRALVTVPGTARRLVEVAVAAGLRLVAPPGLLLLSPDVEPPDSLAISNYFLF